VDIRARFSGKYLAVLLPATPSEQARHALERLRVQVLETPLIWQETPIRATISSGLVSLNPAMESVSVLLTQAEEALQRARRQGVNSIEISAGGH
jgi:diguanylate cyclase (GGDEF)-like protein